MKSRFETAVIVILSVALGWSLSSRPASASSFSDREIESHLNSIADNLACWIDFDIRERNPGWMLWQEDQSRLGRTKGCLTKATPGYGRRRY